MAPIRSQVNALVWACISWMFALGLAILSYAAPPDAAIRVGLAYTAVAFLLAPFFAAGLWQLWGFLATLEMDDTFVDPHPPVRRYRCRKCSDHVTVGELNPKALSQGTFVCRACVHEPDAMPRSA